MFPETVNEGLARDDSGIDVAHPTPGRYCDNRPGPDPPPSSAPKLRSRSPAPMAQAAPPVALSAPSPIVCDHRPHLRMPTLLASLHGTPAQRLQCLLGLSLFLLVAWAIGRWREPGV